MYLYACTVLLTVIFTQTVNAEINTSLPDCVVKRIQDPALTARGETKIYRNEYLEAISMPIGGIGTGCIQINGRAERAIWQIFNNLCNPEVADSFFAIRCHEKNKSTPIRALQTSNVGPFDKMDKLVFRGEYPLAIYDFNDANLPVHVSMEVFSPFIPLDTKHSAIPCAIFNITVSNPTDTAVEVSLLAAQKNAVGFAGPEYVIQQPADSIVFSDFEEADYGSWETQGDAFGKRPLSGVVRPEQQLEGFQGKGLVNTYNENGDTATGRLKSPEFIITKNYIHFLIAGGQNPDSVCINLFIENQKTAAATGDNSDKMKWKTWDVSQFKGKNAHLEIIDSATGPWGHIDIDSIIFSDEPDTGAGTNIKFLGKNKNRIVKSTGQCSLEMTIDRKKSEDDKIQAEQFCAETGIDMPHYDGAIGSMTLMAITDKAEGTARWENVEELYKRWLQSGQLTGPQDAGPSESGKTFNGALAVPFVIEPLQSKTVTFILTWYFPNVIHGTADRKWNFKGNMYANWWTDSSDTARYVKDHFKELAAGTHLFHDTFYASNLPYWLLDRIGSQTAILDSKTFFWSQDGYLGCYEGCSTKSGCCQGNCSHVYHYAQSHARLFPSLARKMREQAYSDQREDGLISNRYSYNQEAIDAMCGEILGTYREYQMSSSADWLAAGWPSMQKAMEYIIKRWDSDEDGVLSGLQHNTLDTEISGSSPWLGSLYLAALNASEKTAQLQNDPASAARFRAIGTLGAKNQNERLWNGQYYIQIPDANLPAHNIITGCSIDQVLGEWWANQVGLKNHYPAERVRSALYSLLRYNFRCSFVGIEQHPRKFVDDQDAGMQMICWPNKGDRPVAPLFYGDEVMTGFEYSAAATMIQFGMLNEGLMAAKAVYNRYDGRMRSELTKADTASWGYSGNPFGDDECGKFYGRAMSVWSLLLACQGFSYNGPEKSIGFDPVWQPNDHASFFTSANGWGLFEQKQNNDIQTDVITIAWGKLEVSEILLSANQGYKVDSFTIRIDDKPISAEITQDKQDVVLKLKNPVSISSGQKMKILLDLESN